MATRKAEFKYDPDEAFYLIWGSGSFTIHHEEDAGDPSNERLFRGFRTQKLASDYKRKLGLNDHVVRRVVCLPISSKGEPCKP